MVFWFGAYGMLLIGAAYTDIIKRKVPDFLTASMWLLLTIASWHTADFSGLVCAGAAFSFLYAFNAFSALFDKPAYGWADVLLYPVYVAFIFLMLPSYVLQVLYAVFPLALCGLVMAVKLLQLKPAQLKRLKKGAPVVVGEHLAAYILIGYLLAYFGLLANLFG
jgi:Flp pilus assembly protein protease CpaA